MSIIEFEDITTRYEFEDRAAFFVADVEKLSKRYTSSHIEVENTTLERLSDLQNRIGVLKQSGKDPELLKRLTSMEYDFQAQSAQKNRVIVTIYTHTSRPITAFGQKVDALAKTYRGVKSDESDVFDFGDDESEENFRFQANFIYDFRNDIKK